MGVEQQLTPIVNGKYKNLNIKPKPEKGIAGLDDGNYIIVKKRFAEGIERVGQFGKSYSCAVDYNGESVSFWLKEREHDVYKNIGGQDDSVKISLKEEVKVNPKTKVKMLVPVLSFELV